MKVFEYLKQPKYSSDEMYYKSLSVFSKNRRLNSLFFYNFILKSIVEEQKPASSVFHETKLLMDLNESVYYRFLFFFFLDSYVKFKGVRSQLKIQQFVVPETNSGLSEFDEDQDNNSFVEEDLSDIKEDSLLSDESYGQAQLSEKNFSIFFKVTSNNIFCGIVDIEDHLVKQCTSGFVMKFYGKKQKKVSVEVSDLLAKYLSSYLIKEDIQRVDVKIYSFFDNTSKSFLRSLVNYGIIINKIINQIPVAHNGCRLKKSRRI